MIHLKENTIHGKLQSSLVDEDEQHLAQVVSGRLLKVDKAQKVSKILGLLVWASCSHPRTKQIPWVSDRIAYFRVSKRFKGFWVFHLKTKTLYVNILPLYSNKNTIN